MNLGKRLKEEIILERKIKLQEHFRENRHHKRSIVSTEYRMRKQIKGKKKLRNT